MVSKQSFLILFPELVLNIFEVFEGGESLHQGIGILGEDWMLKLHFPLQLHLVEENFSLELGFMLSKLTGF